MNKASTLKLSLASSNTQTLETSPAQQKKKPTLSIASARTGSKAVKQGKRKPLQRKSKSDLLSARNYSDWAKNAKALDAAGEGKRWKLTEQSDLYDYEAIRKRLDQLRALRRRGDNHGLVFALDEGVHGNLGGMGKPMLYNQAHFGTKQLITDFIDAVADTLLYIESLPESQISASVKLDLFKRASHCYGRSAIMFSGGGTLVYFHFGVAKSLLEQGLLPSVLSGSSAGSLVCAVLGTRTDAELKNFFTPENLNFGREWSPSLFERFTGLRRLLTVEDFEHSFTTMVPDLTFREAFQISGRHINITVSPNQRHHSPRLLNAITTPHVLIRSAVRASCAVPGIFDPVQLMARDVHGKTVPYLNSRWIDGGFAADLPAKQLARLYGTNHYIVSLINPAQLPIFRDDKLESPRLLPVLRLLKSSSRYYLKASDALIGKYLPASLRATTKLIQNLLAQDYQGDISIVPGRRLHSPLKLVSPSTHDEIITLMLDGQSQTWPRMELIRNSSKISRTLDGILKRAGEDGHSGY
jgi:TAG lipase / steryl ester hydrolase / phospholipase A2 / LPA acyltransferase